MTHGLANVFVNDQRVEDLDNPELKIRDIIKAYGRDPARCVVYRLDSEDEDAVEPVALDERVDLAELQGNLYLRCETKRSEVTAPHPGSNANEPEGLSETERVPTLDGALGDLETEQTLDAEEREQAELMSPATGQHPGADPSGHQFYDRDPEPNWSREEQGSEPSQDATRTPSALGSELRRPQAGRRGAPRSSSGRSRRRAEETPPSTMSTRGSPSRRRERSGSSQKRSGR